MRRLRRACRRPRPRRRLTNAPPQQKPTHPDLAVGLAALLRRPIRSTAWATDCAEVELADRLARRILVGRRAARRRQHVGRDGHEAFKREPPGDILDMRGESAIFVDHDHHRRPARAPLRTRRHRPCSGLPATNSPLRVIKPLVIRSGRSPRRRGWRRWRQSARWRRPRFRPCSVIRAKKSRRSMPSWVKRS